MRKLKLQMQVSVDGYIAGPNNEMDWMTMQLTDDIKHYVMSITDPVDTILIGRKLAEGFIPYWEGAAANPQIADAFARKINETPKIVFSNTLGQSPWKNAKVVRGNLAEEVTRIKNLPGKDIIAYGGADFVSNLISTGLIDEYHLSVNPTAIGEGKRIFKHRTNLKLVASEAFANGKVVLHYQPSK
jgi:dihydrofolate reductase